MNRGKSMRAVKSLAIVSLLFVPVLVLSAGCNGKNKKTKTAKEGDVPESMKGTAKSIEDDRFKCQGEGKGYKVENLDLNHDTVPDVKKVYATVTKYDIEKEVMICREADLNFDGRKDIIRYFSDEGRPLREELDMDFDGKIDVVNYFENGKVVKQEMDTNFDGLVDIWNYFSEGQLVRAERDSDKDGKADIWEHYSGGELKRIGYDVDGDGKVDRWERSEEGEEEVAEKPVEKEEGESGEGGSGEGGSGEEATEEGG
jgi:hypothetical protein